MLERSPKFINVYKNVKEKMLIFNHENRLYELDENGLFYSLIAKEKEGYIINNLVDIEFRDKVSPGVIELVNKKLLLDGDLTLDKEKLNIPSLLNFKNGVLDIEHLTLMDKDPNRYIFTYQIDANYLSKKEVKGKEGRVFINFLNTCMESKEKIELLLSIIGYLMTDYIDARVMFFLVGSTGAGKSVIEKLLIKLVGENNVTNLALSDFSGQFNIAMLRHCRLNINAESGVKPINSSSNIKAIVSGDRIFSDQKNQEGVNFRPHCKLVQIGNQVPQLKDDKDEENAFRDRFVVLKFNNTIPKEQRDSKLFEKLLLELDFIASISIVMFKQKVLDNNFIFSQPKESLIFTDNYFSPDSELGNVDSFIKSKCQFGEYREYISTLYEAYKIYTLENNLKSNLSQNKFSKLMEEVCKVRGIKKERYRQGEENKYGFVGLKLNTSN